MTRIHQIMDNNIVPKKMLIIGSHGFIGGYLCNKFLREGWEVIGVDNVNMYKPNHWELFVKHFEIRQKTQLVGLTSFYRFDVSQASELDKVLKEFEPTIVINLASVSVADVCLNNIQEAVTSIYNLNANVLSYLQSSKFLKRYVYVSSSMVYGDFVRGNPTEDHPKNPKDPYGAIKLGGEFLVESFGRQFNLPYTIIRPSAVYGPLDSNMRVTGIFFWNASHGKNLVVGSSEELLDFTYVEDLVDGIYSAATLESGRNEIFNLTRWEGRKILDLATLVSKEFNNVKIVLNDSGEHMPGLLRPIRGGLSIEKARKLLGYNPKVSLEEGIIKYAKSWKEIFKTNNSTL